MRAATDAGHHAGMAIIRISSGSDGQSHFDEIQPRFEPQGDRSETAELIPGSGILIRRFEAGRTNPWHHAPGRYAVFTLSGAVDIEIGDGTLRRVSVGDILIAEDLSGQGHTTREVGPDARVSVFVPLP
jgi:quercetin dioxygenase-like cupin family protein